MITGTAGSYQRFYDDGAMVGYRTFQAVLLKAARRRTGRKRCRGFSLVEALVAMVITSMALMGFMSVLPLSISDTQQDSQHIQAVAAGQQYLDALEQSIESNPAGTLPAPPSISVELGYSSFGSNGTQLSSSQTFALANNGCPVISGSTLRHDCAVTVRWVQQGSSKQLVLEAYITEE